MVDKTARKREGFEGQRLIVLPRQIATHFLTRDPITRQAYITDIGYYPQAKFHHVERPGGIGQHIIIYCVVGQGWVEIGKQRMNIGPSQFIIIPANTPHKYGSHEKDPWTIYWIHFKGEIAADIVDLILQQTNNYCPHISFNENRIKLFEVIYVNLQKGYSNENLRYVNMIFYHFLSSLLYEEKFNAVDSEKPMDMIDSTIELMQKKLHTIVTLQEFARYARMSVSHFSTVFKERTGYAPIEYFNHLKVQKACQSLLFSNLTIKEIADQVGVDDPAYFSRMFSRLMGVSPNGYRKKNKG